MPTPLLAFLNDIEDALRSEATIDFPSMWSVSRIVNYHHGLARMTLTPLPTPDAPQRRGAIFLQSIPLADGTLCFKASLNWHGSDAFPIITVHSKPHVSWKNEATRIAAAWLAGPPVAFSSATTQSASPLLASID